MKQEKLRREIGFWSLVSIAINTIIGAGIFGLPSKAFEKTSAWSLPLFLVCAVFIALIVLCFAEVSSRFRQTGGMYVYALKAFNPMIAFEVGWLYWLVRVTTFAANCNLLLAYLAFFVQGINVGSTRILLIVSIVSLLTLVNILGIRESVWITNIFTIGKLLPLAVFILFGFFFVKLENFSFSQVPTGEALAATILLLLYAYVGFESAAIPAGETKNPERDLPRALLTSLLICTLIFTSVQFVAIGTFPGLASSERPLADAASVFMGSSGGFFIALGAVISILGNLNGGFLAASRLPFAMAEEDESLPEILAKTHKKFQTPYISIILTSLPILILTIQSSFLSALTMATVTRLVVYAITCVSLIILRQRKDVPEPQFKLKFGVVISLLSIVLIIALLTTIDSRELINLLISLLIGLIIYSTFKLLRSLKKY